MHEDLKPAFNRRHVAIDKQRREFLQRTHDIGIVVGTFDSDVTCNVNMKCIAERVDAMLPATVHFILFTVTAATLSTIKYIINIQVAVWLSR